VRLKHSSSSGQLPAGDGPGAKPDRRATLPSLMLEHSPGGEAGKVASGRRVSAPGHSKSVRFCDEDDELFEAFTPYAHVYGEHPSGFVFDEVGNMVQAASPSAGSPGDLSGIDVGTWLECVAACGVGYRKHAHFTARFDDLRTLEFGDRVKVEERSGEWIRDKVGWLPLCINSMPVFEALNTKSPRRRMSIGTPRRGVMISKGKAWV